MATAPTTFFPTTMVPPPPCGCGAPPYAPCSFSTAASYKHPFPFEFYPTYTYAPPAPVYPQLPNGFGAPAMDPFGASTISLVGAPASEFFPAAANPSTPNLFGATTPAPVSFLAPGYDPYALSSEIHTQIDPNWPPAAPTPIHGDLHHHHRSPSTHDHLPVQAAPQPNAAPIAPSRESLPAQSRHTLDSRPPQSKTSTRRRPPSSPSLPRREDGTLQRELLNIEARLDQQQARERIAIETIQDGLVKLTSMASQLAVAMGIQTTKVLATEPSATLALASTSPATTALRSSDMGAVASSTVNSLGESFAFPTPTLAAPAYVAPQMFDEMPTPQSGYENCCSGNQNPIPSSYVHGGNTNLREQYIDEVPQSYGFSNLINRSVSLADGTKHCYYALPEDYPLQLASPPMSPSTEGTIGVTAPFSVAAGLSPVLCSKANTDGSQPMLTQNQQQSMTGQDLSKITETYPFVRATPQPVFDDYGEEIDGCTNEFVDIFAGIREQQEYEDEQHKNSQALKRFSKPMFSSERLTVDTVVVFSLATGQKPDTELCGNHVKQQVNSQQWNMHMTEATRKEWDPGTLQSIMDVPALVELSSSEGLPHAVIFSQSILLSMIIYAATSIPNIMVSLPLSIQWDPGDNTMLRSALNRDIVAVLQTTILNTSGICTVPYVLTVRVQIRVPTRVPQQSFYGRVLSSQENHGIKFLLDPGILNQTVMMLVLSARFNGSTKNYLADRELMANTSTKVAALTWYNSLPGTLSILLGSTTYTWDPGVPEILHSYTATHPIVAHPGAFTHVLQCIFASATECCYVFCLVWTEVNGSALFVLVVPCSACTFVAMHFLFLSNSDSSRTRHSKLFMQSLCATTAVQVTDRMQCIASNGINLVLHADVLVMQRAARLSQGLASWPHQPVSSALCIWDPGIAISSYMLNWLKMRAVKTLHWLKRPLLNDEECQSAMSNTPCVWDPGIESLLFPCNRLNITKLIQIKRWTSMTYSGISLSEYPYTMIFIHDQWDFIHQQGIQEIYNPKLLLSSQDCAKVQEMDVIFITFLPP